MEKLLPQNIEAEESVLGSLIIDPEAITLVEDALHPDDFYRDAHKTLYQAMLTLSARREPADFVTLCDELERTSKFALVGGASAIASLMNGVPTSANAVYYARIVAQKALYRRLIHAAGRRSPACRRATATWTRPWEDCNARTWSSWRLGLAPGNRVSRSMWPATPAGRATGSGSSAWK
jgi:hypothetical protein